MEETPEKSPQGDEKEESQHQASMPVGDDKKDLTAILSYIGILVLVPLLAKKDDEFVKFHVKQGLVLFIAEVATLIISWIPIIGWILGFIAWIVWVILSIIGIMNVVNGRKASLPLVGQYADSFKI